MKSARSLLIAKLAALALAGAALSLCACGPEPPTKHFVLFVDTSASVTAEHSQHWLPMAAQALVKFQAGDKVTVYELNDQTRNNHAAYEGEVAPLHPRASLDDRERARVEVVAVQRQALQKVAAIISDARRSMTSDVFGAIDRLHPAPQRRLVVLFLSDMLACGHDDPDLEKTAITPDNAGTLFNTVAQKHRWGAQMLAQTDVHVVLPAKGAASPNDRRVLQEFYSNLFTALGARMVGFETSLDAKLIEEAHDEKQSQQPSPRG